LSYFPLVRQTIPKSTWAEIHTAYASGIGLREIARNMGIPEGTILSRAKREGWTREIQNAKALAKREDSAPAVTAAEAVAMTMQQRGQRHIERMAGVTEKVVEHVESLEPGVILDQIDKVEKADRVGRRTFGLSDDDSHGNNVIVNVALLGLKPEELMVEGRDAERSTDAEG
jgi:hypothetical protein